MKTITQMHITIDDSQSKFLFVKAKEAGPFLMGPSSF